jgi:hypothetical protein
MRGWSSGRDAQRRVVRYSMLEAEGVEYIAVRPPSFSVERCLAMNYAPASYTGVQGPPVATSAPVPRKT